VDHRDEMISSVMADAREIVAVARQRSAHRHNDQRRAAKLRVTDAKLRVTDADSGR